MKTDLPPTPRVIMAYYEKKWRFVGLVDDESKQCKELIKGAACVLPQPCSVIVARLQISERADSEIL